MTDNEIKCEKCFHQHVCEKRTCAECVGGYCDDCEIYSQYDGKADIKNCNDFVDADLINRQKAEIESKNGIILKQKELIERTQKLVDDTDKNCRTAINIIGRYERQLKSIKAEAVKEFAERLCDDRLSNDPVVIAVKVELKEIVGEEK